MPGPGPNPAQQREFKRLVGDAVDGRLEWLDLIIRDAGYIHPEDGIAQKDLVREVPGLTRASLAGLEADGLPTVKRRRRKYYPLMKLVAFLYGRYVRPGRPREAGGEEREAHDDMAAKYRALLRKLDYEQRAQDLISRERHEQELAAMAVQIKAALFAAAATLPAQLANQDVATIRNHLEAHFAWQCRNMAAGHVTLPQELLDAVDDIIRSHTDA